MAHSVRYLVITPTGDYHTGTSPQWRTLLDTLYEEIGCDLVDVVRLADDLCMYIDDEGLVIAEPVINPVATHVAAAHGFTHQPYAGTVVFVGGVDRHGNDTSLSDEAHDRVMRLAREHFLFRRYSR